MIESSFYIRTEAGERRQDSGETERGRGRNSERRQAVDVALVVKLNILEYTCLIMRDGNIWYKHFGRILIN